MDEGYVLIVIPLLGASPLVQFLVTVFFFLIVAFSILALVKRLPFF